jgi:hypothetical protein
MRAIETEFPLPDSLQEFIVVEADAICGDPRLLAAIDVVLTEIILIAERTRDVLEAEGNPYAKSFARLLPLAAGMFAVPVGAQPSRAQVMCLFVGAELGARCAARAGEDAA